MMISFLTVPPPCDVATHYRFADIIQSIPEKAAVVIGREWICHEQKDHRKGSPSQHSVYTI